MVQAITEGENATIFVDETPFYATMGGQQADIGTITLPDAEFEVKDVIHRWAARSAMWEPLPAVCLKWETR